MSKDMTRQEMNDLLAQGRKIKADREAAWTIDAHRTMPDIDRPGYTVEFHCDYGVAYDIERLVKPEFPNAEYDSEGSWFYAYTETAREAIDLAYRINFHLPNRVVRWDEAIEVQAQPKPPSGAVIRRCPLRV